MRAWKRVWLEAFWLQNGISGGWLSCFFFFIRTLGDKLRIIKRITALHIFSVKTVRNGAKMCEINFSQYKISHENPILKSIASIPISGVCGNQIPCPAALRTELFEMKEVWGLQNFFENRVIRFDSQHCGFLSLLSFITLWIESKFWSRLGISIQNQGP